MVLAEPAADLNFNTLIALGALVAAVIAILMKFSDKSLSRNEHVEFRSSITNKFDEWRSQVHRDFDRIEADIRLIDANKPSVGELQEAWKALDARVSHLEAMVRDVKNNHQ